MDGEEGAGRRAGEGWMGRRELEGVGECWMGRREFDLSLMQSCSTVDKVDCSADKLYEMSRDELRDLCGVGDGVRLFSQLQKDKAQVSSVSSFLLSSLHLPPFTLSPLNDS